MHKLRNAIFSFIAMFAIANQAIALSPTRGAISLKDFRTPSLNLPVYGQYYKDPIFKSRVFRITGDPGTVTRGMRSRWSTEARHRYSKISPWNCNGSLALITNAGASTDKVFVDAATMRPRYERRSPGTELRWLPTRPNVMFYTNANAVGLWNVKKDTRKIIHRFSGMTKVYIGPWEGNLSHRGDRVALMGDDGNRKWIIVYSIEKKRELARRRLDKSIDLDWLSISPSGQYLVMNGTFADGRDRTKVFDLRFRQLQYWKQYGTPRHYDLTFDPSGREVAVGVAKSGRHEGRVIKRELATGRITPLTSSGYASHTSARNINRPGWAYVTYQGASSQGTFRDEVVAVRTDGSQRFERIAQLRSNRTHYRAEAHAAPSPDGRYVMWASNWNHASGQPIGTLVARVSGVSNAEPRSRCAKR